LNGKKVSGHAQRGCDPEEKPRLSVGHAGEKCSMTNGMEHPIKLEDERTRRRMLRETEAIFQSLDSLCESIELIAVYPPHRYLLSVATGLGQLKADLHSDYSNGGLSLRQLAMAADILAGFKATLIGYSKHVIT